MVPEEKKEETYKKASKAQAGIPKAKGKKPPINKKGVPHDPNTVATQTTSKTVHKLLQAESLDYLRDALTKGNANGVPFYKEYIDAFLKNALENPEGVCSRMLGSGLFSENTLSKLDKEATEVINKNKDFTIYRLRQTMFEEQQRVFDDDIDPKMIVICSRRAGKTELNARKIVKVCLSKESPVLYINKTFENAIRQMFDLVLENANVCELPILRASKSEGYIEFANGSSVKFGGCNDLPSIDKFRGYKFKLVIIDEIGHIKNTKYLIDEVLTPATADFKNAQMVFTGTPPRTKNFATKLWNSNIRKFHWTFEQNPFIPNAHGFIERVCKEKGLTMDDPYIQREYFGNMDAYDTDAIVFNHYRTYENLPQDHIPTRVYIGVDFGYVDDNAIITVSVDFIKREAYVIAQDVFDKAGAEEIMTRVQKAHIDALEYMNNYYSDDKEIRGRVKIITDTNEPALASDMQNKYGLPVEKAYKYDLAGSINELAAEIRTRCFIKKGTPLEDEFQRTVWKRDEEDKLLPEIDDDAFHPNAAHALRYAARVWTERWRSFTGGNAALVDATVMPGLEDVKENGWNNNKPNVQDTSLPPWMRREDAPSEIVYV